MSVFRVEKTKDYTVMSNHHLRNSELSLRAKGLLSQILSLPEGWDYTIAGLAAINREGKDAVRAAVQELEKAGYIERRQRQDSGGKFGGNEYVVHEYPVSVPPLSEKPTTVKPSTVSPSSEEPLTEEPLTGNPTELNKDISSKDISKKKNIKRKAAEPKSAPPPLTDEELWQLAREGIIHIADPSWTRESKLKLHELIMSVYDPNREMRPRSKPPARSKQGVTLMFSALTARAGNDVDAMIGILSNVILNGWTNVKFPEGGKHSPKQIVKPPREERQYQCL